MMRVLCLGNNTKDTDTKTRHLADKEGAVCHGLLSELEGRLSAEQYSMPGYYHSSVYDIHLPNLVDLANEFDLVVMLDQPKAQWSHPNAWLNTVRLLKRLTTKTQFINAKEIDDVEYFLDLIETNKAFCIHPFIQMHTNYDHSVLCCRSRTPVADLETFEDFHSDHRYRDIRDRILNGQKIKNCDVCYNLESKGIISDRIQDTIEWANRLDLKTIDDLRNISQPVFYDIRPSNKCNLTCRMCSPANSHLIEKEYKTIGLIDKSAKSVNKHRPRFDMIHYENLRQVCIAGGEPTVISEFYQWLDHCVAEDHTDFAIELITNGTNITPRLKSLLPRFKQFNFVFSIDAYQDLNRYIRWPTEWDDVIDNWRYLRDQKHPVTLSTTISIYNISRLSELFEFVDREFPGTLIHPSLVSSPASMSPYLFPDRDLVLKDLHRVRKTHSYRSLDFMKTVIDDFVTFYQDRSSADAKGLRDFFSMNDKLDQSRGVYLRDLLPSLDNARHLIYNVQQ